MRPEQSLWKDGGVWKTVQEWDEDGGGEASRKETAEAQVHVDLRAVARAKEEQKGEF